MVPVMASVPRMRVMVVSDKPRSLRVSGWGGSAALTGRWDNCL